VPPLPALDSPYALDAPTIASFAEKGHCVVRGLASRDEVDAFRPAIEEIVGRVAAKVPPLEQRATYFKAFLQVHNLWQQSDVVAHFVQSSRFARVAAEIMGVDGVRLYHDQALCKEAGGGYTPWHQDRRYWPLDTEHTVTMWMPLVDVPAEIGTMSFASGSNRCGELGPWTIGDESEESFARVVAELGLPVETHGALRAGDATFHAGWTLHRAPANGTDVMRSVMTVIYFADGACVGEVAPTMVYDHTAWLDGIPTGKPAAGPLNPVLYSRA
jgi:ectoine hydroxylase-related dioxygenase (phytanoyl-CoA dioxygenase family)